MYTIYFTFRCILSKFYIKPQQANPELVAAYRCILSKFYIKPQRRNAGHGNTFGCILSKFYIKPQRVRPIRISLIVVSYRNSTSNHNYRSVSYTHLTLPTTPYE